MDKGPKAGFERTDYHVSFRMQLFSELQLHKGSNAENKELQCDAGHSYKVIMTTRIPPFKYK